MTSEPRIDFDGAWHHVMNRGHNREAIFRDEDDCRSFAAGLSDVTGAAGIEIHAYAFMSNHFHLMVHAPHAGLADAMQHVESLYAVRYNKKYGREGAVYKGRYRSVLLDSEPHFLEVPRYIENNPVAAGVVHDPASYRWSSHRVLALDEPAPDFLSTDIIVPNYFDGSAATYKAFVNERNSPRTKEYAASIETRALSVQLTEQLEEYRRAVAAMPTAGPIAEIESYVASAFGIGRHLLRYRGQAFDQVASALVLTLLYRRGDATPTELAAEYGYTSRAGVTSAIRRCERKAAEDPHLQSLIEAGLALCGSKAA